MKQNRFPLNISLHVIRSGFKTSDQVQGQGAGRSRKRSLPHILADEHLSEACNPPRILADHCLRWGFETTSRESHLAVQIFICFFALLSSVMINSAIALNAFAGELKQNDKITIVTAGTVARLCPHPGCGPDKHITRIPQGTVLSVEGMEYYTIGTFKVKWFEVVYKENRGWISIYDTDKAP